MAKAKKRTATRRSVARKSAARRTSVVRSAPARVTKHVNTKTNASTLAMTFVIMLAVNSAVVWLANMLLPTTVVLGTFNISKFWAILYSMGALSLVNTAAVPFMYKLEEWKGSVLTSMDWMFQYFVLNFMTVYVLTRVSEVFGLGVSSWLVVVILAAVLDFVQGIAMMQYSKVQEANK